MAAYAIDLVVDVGANRGQYAADLRAAGYDERIVSFEPLDEPYRRLAEASADDAAWEVRRLALGRAPAIAEMHVSEDTRNSSLLVVGERHVRAVPHSRTVGLQRVEIARLDAIWSQLIASSRRAYLKMDTQGYELEVLRGATAALRSVVLLEAEVSLVPVYGPAASFEPVTAFLSNHGFAPIAFEGVLDDADTGEMLQADVIFRRVRQRNPQSPVDKIDPGRP